MTCALAAFLLAVAIPTAPPADKPVVMVLGTYHMANPGLDAVQVKQRDTLGEPRQREIADLVNRLAKFEPTKIFVEVVPESQAALDTRYAEYQAGRHTLSSSETEQVGFRLAKQRRLTGVKGVDYKSDMDFGKVMGFAAQNGMGDFAAEVGRLFGEIGKFMTDLDQKHTVGELLALHNDEAWMEKGHSFYLRFLKVGKGEQHPGADLVAGWYRRNLMISERIRAACEPGDRVLVIYGSGHAHLLNQFLRESGHVQVIGASEFLPKPPKVTWPEF